MKLSPFYLVLSFLLLASCATSKLQTRLDRTIDDTFNQEEVVNTIYVTGNAANNSEATVSVLSKIIAKNASKEKSVLFMGDNIDAEDGEEEKLKKQLDPQIRVAKTTGATPYFLPGNYEWDFNKTKGLETIEDYLKENFEDGDILTPNNGCPLESIELSENIQLIAVDSQWFIEDWDKNPNMNDKCQIKTREKLLLEIAGEIKKSANKIIIFAMHHPMFTNGFHGGRFSFRDHIFPLQGNIPFPGVGTLITEIRSQGGVSKQNRFNYRYSELMKELEILLNKPDHRILIVSGHEENLQYIEEGNFKQLVSGAASSAKPVSLSDNGIFSYGKQGFASVEITDKGSVWVSFYASEEKKDASNLLFRRKIFQTVGELETESFPKTYPRTYTASVYDIDKVEKSDFFKSFWGQHYRDVYGTKVTAATALLDTLYGGLEVVRPGGGHQTRSLRLVTKDGKEYNMRALKKSAVQLLETTTFNGIDAEKYFSNTVPEDLILDFYTAAHPYGAFAIPKLAKAAGVYYTTPELYYVPKQQRLGKYNEDYGNQLYMIVERPAEEYENRKSFGYPDNVESTDDLLEKLREDEDHTLDEATYIRARIFDMLIGDWDRHSDQWRWSEFEDEGEKLQFIPIPRDRDQVFANFDGSFLNLLRKLAGSVNQFGIYNEDIKDVAWFNKAGSKLDRALIKRSDKSVWMEEAKKMQQAIDEEILDNAFKDLPMEVQDTTSSEIKKSFLKRKENLVHIVERYYQEFIKFQMLTGTDKDDHFVINRQPNGKTQIIAYRIKDGEKGDVLFDRVFNSEETKEIWLYGLDDDDVFEVNGVAEKAILIRLIGGQDDDIYNISEGKKIVVYDNKDDEVEIKNKGGARFKTTNIYEANSYDYTKKKSSTSTISLETLYNNDTGVSLKASYTNDKFNFIKNPYSKRTNISLDYNFQTTGFDIDFLKGFAAVVNDFNLVIDGRYTSLDYTENFFGFGNETINPEDDLGLSYNRIQMERIHGGLALEKETDYGSFFQLKLNLNTLKLINNESNFLLDAAPEEYTLRSYFAVPEVTYSYKNYNADYFPSKGMFFSATVGGIDNLKSNDITGFLKSSVLFYNSLLSNNRLVLETGASTHLQVGDRPEFHQTATLGAKTGLRGYREGRFKGFNSFLGKSDLLYTFQPIKTALFPVTVRIRGGYNIGRVWVKRDTSEKWYDAYGGGFDILWTNAIVGSFTAFKGEEGTRLSFGLKISY